MNVTLGYTYQLDRSFDGGERVSQSNYHFLSFSFFFRIGSQTAVGVHEQNVNDGTEIKGEKRNIVKN